MHGRGCHWSKNRSFLTARTRYVMAGFHLWLHLGAHSELSKKKIGCCVGIWLCPVFFYNLLLHFDSGKCYRNVFLEEKGREREPSFLTR